MSTVLPPTLLSLNDEPLSTFGSLYFFFSSWCKIEICIKKSSQRWSESFICKANEVIPGEEYCVPDFHSSRTLFSSFYHTKVPKMQIDICQNKRQKEKKKKKKSVLEIHSPLVVISVLQKDRRTTLQTTWFCRCYAPAKMLLSLILPHWPFQKKKLPFISKEMRSRFILQVSNALSQGKKISQDKCSSKLPQLLYSGRL